MHSLNQRLPRSRSEDEEIVRDLPRMPKFSRATWAATSLAVGTGLTLYGANAQKKAQAGADNANRYAAEQADLRSWRNYLAQRGVYAPTAAQGEIPGARPGAPVNTRLPFWATLNTTPSRGITGFQGSLVRRRGA